MADIFLLFLAVYDYSVISTVISGSHLDQERVVYSRVQRHLSEMQQGEGERDQIKGMLNSTNPKEMSQGMTGSRS